MPVVAFKKRTEKQQLLCTKCGSVGGAAPCDCGAQHLVYAKAGEIAKELIERFPGRSARRIAEESGVSYQTVNRMRSGDTNVSPAKVTGRDGKQYTTKRKKSARAAPALDEQANRYLSEFLEFLVDYCQRVEHWPGWQQPGLNKEIRKGVVSQLYQCAERVQRLAQAIDGRSPEAAWSDDDV
jgi:hypothetical protein